MKSLFSAAFSASKGAPLPLAKCGTLKGSSKIDMLLEAEDCQFRCVGLKKEKKAKGTANAARVSRGSQFDAWDGLSLKAPKRDARQHATVTVVIYNTVAGGVPGVEDVLAAIEDMDALYAACGWTGALASDGAAFMKSELTVNNVLDIASKTS